MWKFRLVIAVLFFAFMYREFFSGNELPGIVNGFFAIAVLIWSATTYLKEYIDSKFDNKDGKQ